MKAGFPMSHLTHAGLACLLLHNGGVVLGLKRGPWVSQCPTCWSRAASHCIAGAAWMQPKPTSRTRVHEIEDDTSGMVLAVELIAGWRDAIGLPVPLMQGLQRDAGCEQAAVSDSSNST